MCRDPGPGLTVVSRKWPPAMGGMETYSVRMVETLETVMPVRRLVLPGKPDGSPPGALALIWFGARNAAHLIFDRNPTPVVHVMDMASWPLALAALLRQRGRRLVLSAHGTDVGYAARPDWKGRLYALWLRAGGRLLGSATVIANSEETARRSRDMGFYNVRVVPLAADPGPMPDPSPPGRSLLFAGRLIRRKGCAWFIRNVLPHLPEGITLDVAGTPWDADEEAALDHPRVRFLGRLDADALRSAYAGALAVIVPNQPMADGTYEGFGLVAVEAAAAGGLVLASRHGGLTDAVIDGETGFLLPEGDAEAWITRIGELAGWSLADRQAFTTKAREKAVAYYSWTRVANETRSIYDAPASGDAA